MDRQNMGIDINPEEIGRRIKIFRTQRGLTQMELAERINLSFQQVQKYEKGKSEITLQRLWSIANAVDVSIFAFFADSKQQYNQIAEDQGRYYTGDELLLRITKEEERFLKKLRSIRNRRIREGFFKILKAIIDTEHGK